MNVKRTFAVLAATAVLSTQAFASGGTGGGGGGAGTVIPNPLPTTPPAPDIVLRESFGPGADPSVGRPEGGKGTLRPVFAGTGLAGYWLEYPGNKSTTWSTPDVGPGWHYAYASLNPFEAALPSPIQPDPFNGVIISEWRDGTIAWPDAVVPFRGVAGRYSLSAEMYPGGMPGAGQYVGIGLTGSAALQSNLGTSGQIWIRLSQTLPNDGMHGQYEVLIGNQVLIAGPMILDGFNPLSITVDPAAQTVDVVLNGVNLGTFTARVSPSYIAVEGQGFVDDIVVRTVP